MFTTPSAALAHYGLWVCRQLWMTAPVRYSCSRSNSSLKLVSPGAALVSTPITYSGAGE
jgi:hypothetical protein